MLCAPVLAFNMNTLQLTQPALDALIEAAAHLRNCARCARLFRAAHEVVAASQIQFPEFRPWGLTNLLLPELRRCRGWPQAI